MLFIIPKPIKSIRRCDPPAEKKGKAIPTIGSNPKFIPILTKVSTNNFIANPIVKKFTKII